jgi:hypothetical protein
MALGPEKDRMTYTRRLAALAAIAFFAILNAGTSQPSDSSIAPAPSVPDMPAGDVDRFCHRPAEGRCQAMRLGAGYEEEAEQLRCQQVNGTWDQTPCDTASIVGRCVAQNRRSTWYFSPPQWTEQTAREMCSTMTTMTWMPGTN